jgi:hypothetical protein
VFWIVGDQSERLALNANEGDDDPDTEIAAYFEHRSLVRQKIDDVANAVDPQLGNGAPQQPLIPRLPFSDRAPKVRQISLRSTGGFCLVLSKNVDDAVRRLK